MNYEKSSHTILNQAELLINFDTKHSHKVCRKFTNYKHKKTLVTQHLLIYKSKFKRRFSQLRRERPAIRQ